MSYTLELMSASDRETFLEAAGPRIRRRFERRNFFEMNVPQTWAVRHDRAAFLLRGPQVDIRSMTVALFLFRARRVFELEIEFPLRAIVSNPEGIGSLTEFRAEVEDAFRVHGLYAGLFPVLEQPGELSWREM